MFRIKASYTGQLELKTTLERAREFFGELTNFADLMPGIEGIRKESGGIVRWLVKADVPVIGSLQASFAVRKTEDRPERLEWSPAGSELKNYLRYAAQFEVRGHNVLIKVSQHVELRRPHARDLHRLAALGWRRSHQLRNAEARSRNDSDVSSARAGEVGRRVSWRTGSRSRVGQAS